MTNKMIILQERVRLMEEGKLKGSGQFIKSEDEDGQEKMQEIPEEIHTFEGWKKRGYCVKKGEHSSIKFPIWKYVTGKKKGGDSEEAEESEAVNSKKSGDRMIIKVAAFFTEEQVEPLKKGAL